MSATIPASLFRVFTASRTVGDRIQVVASCSRCMNTHVLTTKWNMPPDQIAKGIRGWKINRQGDRAVCPECQKGGKKTEGVPVQHLATAPATAPALSVTARERVMFSLLEEHFDGELGVWDEGWSDRRVADECDLKIDRVHLVRESAFGKIRDPRMAEIDALETKLVQELEEIKVFAGDAIRRVGDELRKLRQKIEGVG